MEYTIRDMQNTDASSVMSIYNYYTENDFAGFFDQALPIETFKRFQEMSRNYPALVACDENQEVIGFAFLHAYHPASTFQRTAEVSYFIHREHIGKGLGKLILDKLIIGATKIGVDNIIANISSQNAASLAFHKKHGFRECGRLPAIGNKFGQDFDVVYMQLLIENHE
ncbi:L-amino acid N-acyltransferase YncA [Parabacteroides sp. PFB2-10]|uniref:GNAT family N-acetyltransferase n=1 Tax=Parabacteroides sp. PFB2-10 TaxID=1742405 RepID=UPI002474AEDA|nr:N-acetyltransferase family protein [Parabacteroides sp. PFB2-10]MDH6313022.1 L-amino acid N-acyltransferase YncA [Parabacteroides sp. PFB2-10]MDL2281566.1 N-acetyltransferase family protein [Parabacteroides sp. OttesenSCG-928-G06]MDL2281591.1 N-acetyltransferase family protein [Parabacteroides sp. OttesenSCG-928-G06]